MGSGKLKTKRMILLPLSVDELRLLVDDGQAALDGKLGLSPCGIEPDAELAAAYGDMLGGCESSPGEYLWYTPWLMIIKAENKCVGSLCFKGAPDENGDVEIGYGTDEPYRGRGLCPEALLALCDWALQHGARRVTAQTEPNNSVSQHVLLKCGFIPAGMGEEGPMFARLTAIDCDEEETEKKIRDIKRIDNRE